MQQRRTLVVLFVLIAAGGLLFWNLQHVTSPIRISNPRAVLSVDGEGPAAIYLTLENTGGPDVLKTMSSMASEHVMIMGIDEDRPIVIPAGSKPGFSSDGAHAMINGLEPGLVDGTFVPLVLEFERAGRVSVKARVSRGTQAVGMDHSQHGGVGHTVEEEPVPSVALDVQAARDVYVVTIETQNFEFFQPEADSAEHMPGQGHAHLYLNGLKLQRMFDHSATIGALPPGRHTVRVTLNTNDHKTYIVDGQPVGAATEINVE